MQRVLRGVLIGLVVIGTLVVLALRVPEEKTFVSDDGLLTLRGSFSSSSEIAIADVTPPHQIYTAVVSSIYQLYPPGSVLGTPVELKITFPSTIPDTDAYRLTLGYFDATFGMWRAVDSDVDLSSHTVSANIHQLLMWTVLLPDVVARPNFDAEIESLVASPPDGAVGYQIEVGYADVPGDFAILSGAGKTGGCAGQYKMGGSTQMTSRGEVFSDQLEYQVVAVWQIGEGCQGFEVIE